MKRREPDQIPIDGPGQDKGKDVTVIEMLNDVAIEVNIIHRRALMLELEKSVKVKA